MAENMSKIEEKIADAAYDYIDCHGTFEADTYDDFTAGAKWALSHQWVSVEDALPDNCNELVLVLDNDEAKTAYFKGCSKRWGSQWRIGKDDAFDSVTHWLPIPPPPEARKEGEK